MITRYTDADITQTFSKTNKYKIWFDIEIALLEGLRAPKKDITRLVKLKKGFNFIDAQEIEEIEETTKHDLVAFLQFVEEQLGPSNARYVHYGLTSSDVVDSAMSIMCLDALDITYNNLLSLRNRLWSMAKEHKGTVMLGRTHGQVAELTTFGIKLYGWVRQLDRHLEAIIKTNLPVKFSGSVGTYQHISMDIANLATKHLGKLRKREFSATGLDVIGLQVIPREYYADVVSILAKVACSIERFALDVRLHAQSEIDELHEGFSVGQKGSSSMPFKRNPIGCENICGLSRLVRSYSTSMMENIAVWSERDISHSSVDRVAIEDAFHLVNYMTKRFSDIMQYLDVDHRIMDANVMKSSYKVKAQATMLKLIKFNGVPRTRAHTMVDKFIDGSIKNNELFLVSNHLVSITDVTAAVRHSADEIFDKHEGGSKWLSGQ